MHARPLFLLVFCLAANRVQAQDIRIGVLGIFHPHQLTLSCTAREPLVVTSSGQTLFLQPGSAKETVQIRINGNTLLLNLNGQEIRAEDFHASGRDGGTARFLLSVPGKISRSYLGTLDVKVTNGELLPIITMDLETAVASVVQAESLTGTQPEALKAQAIVTRSYFVGGGRRHTDFDFCDLTHCQFLREPPPPDSPAALATASTKDLILTFEQRPTAAMFTRSCSGTTRTPPDRGTPTDGYPYFSVICDFCYRHPVPWTRVVSPKDAALLKDHSETARLVVARRLGWGAVPSDTFKIRKHGAEFILEGLAEGHGVGLCQRGARAMAEQGSDFREIILHYFPNTTITQRPARPRASGH